jgi:hypothetical protein
MVTNDRGNVGVPSDQPKWVKVLGFDSTKRLICSKPLKSHKKRFLPRISLWGCYQASKAIGYFFDLQHGATYLNSSSLIASEKYYTHQVHVDLSGIERRSPSGSHSVPAEIASDNDMTASVCRDSFRSSCAEEIVEKQQSR